MGVLGCGSIAEIAHFPSIQKTKGLTLEAVCDIDADTAKPAQKKWKAHKWYTDYREMFADADLDAVIIATPNNVHRNQAVAAAQAMLEKAGLPNRLIVDCSHMNANKDHRNEGNVFRNVLEQRLAGNAGVVGVMLESNLNAGNQPLHDDLSELAYGVSITDACIDWQTTEELVHTASEQLKSR